MHTTLAPGADAACPPTLDNLQVVAGAAQCEVNGATGASCAYSYSCDHVLDRQGDAFDGDGEILEVGDTAVYQGTVTLSYTPIGGTEISCTYRVTVQ